MTTSTGAKRIHYETSRFDEVSATSRRITNNHPHDTSLEIFHHTTPRTRHELLAVLAGLADELTDRGHEPLRPKAQEISRAYARADAPRRRRARRGRASHLIRLVDEREEQRKLAAGSLAPNVRLVHQCYAPEADPPRDLFLCVDARAYSSRFDSFRDAGFYLRVRFSRACDLTVDQRAFFLS